MVHIIHVQCCNSLRVFLMAMHYMWDVIPVCVHVHVIVSILYHNSLY